MKVRAWKLLQSIKKIYLSIFILIVFGFLSFLASSPDFSIQIRPLRQIYGGLVQRAFNPLITQPTQEDQKLNPIFNKKIVPTINRNLEMEKIAKKILQEYTPTARFQIEAIPIGAFDGELAGTHGKSVLGTQIQGFNGELSGGGYNRGKSIQATYLRDNLSPKWQELVLRHVLLHTALVDAGGLDTKQFLNDFEKLEETDKILYSKTITFSQDPFYTGVPKQLLAEEIFAQLGAWEGSKIFNTPVGKYYKWILKESSQN